jgi:hypothetical protein
VLLGAPAFHKGRRQSGRFAADACTESPHASTIGPIGHRLMVRLLTDQRLSLPDWLGRKAMIGNLTSERAGDGRGAPRASMYLTAAIYVEGAAIPVKIRNMSSSGALVEGNVIPPHRFGGAAGSRRTRGKCAGCLVRPGSVRTEISSSDRGPAMAGASSQWRAAASR